MFPPFNPERFEDLRQQHQLSLGQALVVSAATGSTNDDALAAAKEGAAHGSVWVTEQQSAGRGRRGNSWLSPAGANLLTSILLRPNIAPERASGLTLAVGLAVRSAAQRWVKSPLGIKWPNDVVAGPLKLGGILVESVLESTGPRPKVGAVVVGIGLNVGMVEMPSELRLTATSLALLGAQHPSREELLADLLKELEARLNVYEESGLRELLRELREHDALFGKPIRVDGEAGVMRGISENGALLLELPGGRLEPRHSGTVDW